MHTRSQTRNLHNQQHQAPPPVVEPFNLEEPLENPPPPLAPMDDQRTMAQLLEAPTAGYEDAIVVPEIAADNFDSLNSAAGGNFLDKMPRDCLRIIESKSKVRNSRNKPVVAKVSSSTSTPGISSEVAELKDMVKALLLDKKIQSPAPTPVKAVEESCVTCGAAANYNQGNTGYRAPISNQIRPLGFPPVQNNHVQNQGNNQNRYNQNRGNFNQAPAYQPPVHQGQIYRPQVVQPPAYQAPAYQAPAPQTQGLITGNDLADLGASINLMPYSVWKNLSLPELTPTCMTLELADRSISEPIGIAEDVYVTVGKFQFPADFVVVDFEPDPRVPLILGRSFLKTSRALIDVYEGEITLRVGREAITFNLDQTSRYTANYHHMTANRIDVIDMACEEYSQEVLGFSNVISTGIFSALEDDPTSPEVDPTYYDPEGDILLLEAILNSDPSPPPPNQENYFLKEKRS
ncbi:reverse transcriptase domain-containing protein [Tanacetum coccineum]